jgi:surface protein
MEETFGDISNWDTSFVTDMSYVFYNNRLFNKDISNWDTQRVLTTKGMFSNATKFNQPIDKWNVSNVIDMSYMFNEAIDFSKSIQNWDLTNKRTDWMFLNAHSYYEQIHINKAAHSTGMFFKAGINNKNNLNKIDTHI